jgi:hypothetical protein
VERSVERQRRRDREEGRTRTADEEAGLRGMQRDDLDSVLGSTIRLMERMAA